MITKKIIWKIEGTNPNLLTSSQTST